MSRSLRTRVSLNSSKPPAAEDVDGREAASDELLAEVFLVRKHHVGEQAAVAVACVFGRIANEADALPLLCKSRRFGLRFLAVTLARSK